ncbi:endonuclease domain-containing protein [Candidatus Uhrbacteria bacterium]|nr:endonuclease domain-containing protein [Candidatus Uhrbacteria bacterium]
MGVFYNQQWQTQRRGELRNNQTKAEWLLWLGLKGKQMGYKFRRQFGVGPYVLDFYCTQLRLGIEVDGGSHFTTEGVEYDSERAAFLKDKKIRVLRFTNREIYNGLEDVLAVIKSELFKSTSP